MDINFFIPGFNNLHIPLTPCAPRLGEPICLIPDQKNSDLINGLADPPQTIGVNFSFCKIINRWVALSGAAQQRSEGSGGYNLLMDSKL